MSWLGPGFASTSPERKSMTCQTEVDRFPSREPVQFVDRSRDCSISMIRNNVKQNIILLQLRCVTKLI